MASPLRIEFPGTLYHVTSRGNARQKIFRDDEDRERFLATLAWVVYRFGWHSPIALWAPRACADRHPVAQSFPRHAPVDRRLAGGLNRPPVAFSRRSEPPRTAPGTRFASSLAAALLDGLFEPPASCHGVDETHDVTRRVERESSFLAAC